MVDFCDFQCPENFILASILQPGQSFWGPGDLFSGFLGWWCVFIEKSAFADPPFWSTFWTFLVFWIDRFFGVLYVVDFCDLIRAARECRRPSNHSAAPCKRLRVVVGTCLWRWPARSASRAGGRTDGRSVGAALRAAFGGA